MASLPNNPPDRPTPEQPERQDRSQASDPARADMGRFEHGLRTVLHRFDCPSPDDLAAYAWGELSGPQYTAINAHLKLCSSCAAEHADFLSARTSANLTQPVQTVATVSLAQALDQLTEPVRKFLARLIPSDPAMMLVLRGEADDISTPRVYAVDELEWQVTLTPIGETFTGQVLGPNEDELAGCRVHLVHAQTIIATAHPDATGWFALPQLPMPGESIWVDMLTLNERIEIEQAG